MVVPPSLGVTLLITLGYYFVIIVMKKDQNNFQFLFYIKKYFRFQFKDISAAVIS